MDESQEREATTLAERLQHELEILTAYQSKSKMAAESQRLVFLCNSPTKQNYVVKN